MLAIWITLTTINARGAPASSYIEGGSSQVIRPSGRTALASCSAKLCQQVRVLSLPHQRLLLLLFGDRKVLPGEKRINVEPRPDDGDARNCSTPGRNEAVRHHGCKSVHLGDVCKGMYL